MKGKVDYTKVPGYKPPDQRVCRQCRKLMRPWVEWEDLSDDATGENVVTRYARKCRPLKIQFYGAGGCGFFCSHQCGYIYACRAINQAKKTLEEKNHA